MRVAYTAVCANENTTIQRARLNVVGHPRAGASTFVQQLMGGDTKGIIGNDGGTKIHSVRMEHNIGSENTPWKECGNDKGQITEGFNKLFVSKLHEIKRNPVSSSSSKEQMTESSFELSNQETTIIKISSRAKQDFASYQGMTKVKKPQEAIILQIWDFNGDDKSQSTQHMFMEPEILTVIAMDITKSLHKPLHEGSQRGKAAEDLETPAEYLSYYLDIIHFKATERNIQPAISLVLTHIDEIPEQHRESHVKSYINNIHKVLDKKLCAKYVTGKNIHVIENTAKSADFRALKDQIVGLISSKRAWGNEIPARWSQLEADIKDKFPSDTVKYIEMPRVTEMANAYGMHEDEVESFLEFHHSVGDWIYCPDAGTLVTDPQWFLDALKSLFQKSDIQNKSGLVSERDLQILWKNEEPSILTHLISSLQLMIPLQDRDERTFLIPSLLPTSSEAEGIGSPPEKMDTIYESLYTIADARNICLDTYHKLMCRLGNETLWKIKTDMLSRLNACFAIMENTMLYLTLMESKIQLTVWSDKGVEYKDLQTNLQKIREILEGLLQKSGIPENNFFQILCPHSTVGDECLVKINVSKNPEDQEIILLPEETKCPVHNENLSPKDFKQFQLEKQEPKVKLGWLLKASLKSTKVEGNTSFHHNYNSKAEFIIPDKITMYVHEQNLLVQRGVFIDVCQNIHCR